MKKKSKLRSDFLQQNTWHHLKDQTEFYKLNVNEVWKVTYQWYKSRGSTLSKRRIEFLVAAM